jgi:hypothetical protein
MEEHIASLLLGTLSHEAQLRGQAESGLAEIQRNGGVLGGSLRRYRNNH